MSTKEQEIEVDIDLDKNGKPDITLRGKFKGWQGWAAFAVVTALYVLDTIGVF